MCENAITESGQYAENTSSGGIKFHLAMKPELLQVPDMLSFNMRTSEGETQEILVNRFENVFVADERYKRCCGRILITGVRGHDPTCWTQRPQKKPRTPGSLGSQRASMASGPVEEGELRPGEYVLPAHEKATRDAYAKAVFKACAGKIQGGMLGEPPLAVKAQPRLCFMWGQSRKRRQKYATGLIPPGLQCEYRCQQFPCVAVTVGAAEEAELRATAWPGSTGV